MPYKMNLQEKDEEKYTMGAVLYVSTYEELKRHAARRGNKLQALVRSAINDLLEKLNQEEKEANNG